MCGLRCDIHEGATGMSEFVLIDHNLDNTKPFPTKAEAEEKRNDMLSLGADPEALEIVHNGDETPEEDASSASEPTVEAKGTPTQDTTELPDNPPVDTDPLTWIPDEFQDTIEGTVAINRKGYEVLAHHYNISVTTKVLVSPSKTDYTYAEVMATAVTDDDTRYRAHGSAHVDRGDDSFLLLEMADTRAAKRATARATGVGMVAVQELKSEL